MGLELETNIINWSDPNQKISEHFTVKDCLMLHNWNRLATSADGADFQKLTILCEKMEQIRNILQCPINVHCAFRSVEYNNSQGIKPSADVHSFSQAMDWDANSKYTTDQIKEILKPYLDSLEIRMENNGPNAGWIHTDFHSVGPSGRFFNP